MVLVFIKVVLSFNYVKRELMKPRQYINVNVPAVVWISKQDLEVYPGDIPAPTQLSLSSAAWLMGARAPKANLQVM